jgi:hypothetical protein
MIGLQSVLRVMSRADCPLSTVLIDADALRPSAVANALGLFAIGSRSTLLPRIDAACRCTGVRACAVRGLNQRLTTTLNLRSVTAIGLIGTPTDARLAQLVSHLPSVTLHAPVRCP